MTLPPPRGLLRRAQDLGGDEPSAWRAVAGGRDRREEWENPGHREVLGGGGGGGRRAGGRRAAAQGGERGGREEWYPLYLSKEVPEDASLSLTVFDRQLVLFLPSMGEEGQGGAGQEAAGQEVQDEGD